MTTQGFELTFKTGRYYDTPQTIYACVVEVTQDEFGPCYTVRFEDASRMTTGTIKNLCDVTPTSIMAAYDSGRYTN